MPDMTFEAKFARVAINELADCLPDLSNYRTGFALIDKSDDDMRAVGVAGFMVGGTQVYVPIFFLNGKISGQDLLYLPDQDMFIPADDGMIASLKKEGLSDLGKQAPKNLRADQKGSAPGDVATWITPSFNKTASEVFDAYEGFLDKEAVARMFRKVPYTGFDLVSDVQLLPKEARASLVDTILGNVDFANAALTFYTPGELEKLASGVIDENREQKAAEARESDLVIIRDMRSKEAADLKPREKSTLVQNGIFIEDKRRETSRIYDGSLKLGNMSNPTEPGVYDVYMSDGSLDRFIILHPSNSGKILPGEHRKVAVIDPTKPTECSMVDLNDIYAKPLDYDLEDSEVSRTIPGTLFTYKNLLSALGNQGYMNSLVLANGLKAQYLVQARKNGAAYELLMQTYRSDDPKPVNYQMVEEGGTLGLRGGVLYIPKGTRFYVVKYSTDLHFAQPNALSNSLIKEADLKQLTVTAVGDSADINFDGRSAGAMSKTAAMLHLVQKLGIRSGDANGLLKKASDEAKPVRYLVKLAAFIANPSAGRNDNSSFNAPLKARQQTSTTEIKNVKGRGMLPAQFVQEASRVAEEGTKDVFDVKVLQRLVDKADIADIKKDFLKKIYQGMDAQGRLLFVLYWKSEDFREEHGDEEYETLEDMLKSNFKTTGKLVMLLREKLSYSPSGSNAALKDSLSSKNGADVADVSNSEV